MSKGEKMNNTRAEARAYNDFLKIDMSIEDKLELLYEDLIDYIKCDLGAKKYEAIKKVVNTFKEHEKDESIRIILREFNYRKNKGTQDSGMFLNAFSIETLKKAVEVVLNPDDMEALLDRITAELWYIHNKKDINEDPMEVVEAILNGNYHFYYKRQLSTIIMAAVAKKYYNYFYRDLEYNLNKIIDNHTYWCESLEPKVIELKARKEEEERGTK